MSQLYNLNLSFMPMMMGCRCNYAFLDYEFSIDRLDPGSVRPFTVINQAHSDLSACLNCES
jgi:hypothetical protein